MGLIVPMLAVEGNQMKAAAGMPRVIQMNAGKAITETELHIWAGVRVLLAMTTGIAKQRTGQLVTAEAGIPMATLVSAWHAAVETEALSADTEWTSLMLLRLSMTGGHTSTCR